MPTAKPRYINPYYPVALVFFTCTAIALFSSAKSEFLTYGLVADLVITAPLLWLLFSNNGLTQKRTALRIMMMGILIATFLLSNQAPGLMVLLRKVIYPVLELALVGYVGWKFYLAAKKAKKNEVVVADFVITTRQVLKDVLGSEKLANVLASEIAVFYYLFKKPVKIDYKNSFTSYKANGVRLVLTTFLCLFVIETVGMHFLLQLWSKTGAWIFTALGLYGCLQLYAHIRALNSRPVMLTRKELVLRNGLLGGDVIIPLAMIEEVQLCSKPLPGNDVVKLAFIKGLENHNIAIHLTEALTVTKAFGKQKEAKVILVSVDHPERFLKCMYGREMSNVKSETRP